MTMTGRRTFDNNAAVSVEVSKDVADLVSVLISGDFDVEVEGNVLTFLGYMLSDEQQADFAVIKKRVLKIKEH